MNVCVSVRMPCFPALCTQAALSAGGVTQPCQGYLPGTLPLPVGITEEGIGEWGEGILRRTTGCVRACRGEAAWGGMAVGGGHNINKDLDT